MRASPRLADRLIQQVSMPYMIEGHNISIGASVGIAIARAGRNCADALIRNADLALYSAKAAGRGTFCFFAPDMHSEAQDRQMLENDLRKAIGRGELELLLPAGGQRPDRGARRASRRWCAGTIRPAA